MKFLLFGTGDYYERYKKWFNKGDVAALLDNSPLKQNTLIDGIKVLAPKDGIELEYDCIVILSFYVKAMRRQLEELGVPSDRVYHFYDLHKLIYSKEIRKPIEYYGASRDELMSDKGQKILLLSQDMTLGGPAIALYHVAEVLKNNGYNVVFATMIDGPLRDRLLDMGIPVIVDVNLQIETMEDAEWVNGYQLIMCNTINFHIFLSERTTDKPIIWWLHDSAFFYDGINRDVLQKIDLTNMYVYSVGPIPRNAMHGYVGGMTIKDFFYGVADKAEDVCRHDDADVRICFVTLGYIEERKGQDILVGAVKKIHNEFCENSVFYLVGQNSSVMAQKIKNETEGMSEIIMTGAVDRKEIDNILNKADVMVIPSREDPMPTVAAEAMMHGVPCIVSDATGTAGYIHDGLDGFIFKSEDVDGLAAKINRCMEHRERLAQMGREARKIYEKYFSMEIFERNLLDIVEGM